MTIIKKLILNIIKNYIKIMYILLDRKLIFIIQI